MEEQRQFCMYCGCPMNMQMRFCPRCGKAVINTPEAVPAAAYTPIGMKPRRGAKILLTVVSAAALVVGGIAFLTESGRNSSERRHRRNRDRDDTGYLNDFDDGYDNDEDDASADIRDSFFREGFYCFKDTEYSSATGWNVWCEIAVSHDVTELTDFTLDSWNAVVRYYVPEDESSDPPCGAAYKLTYAGAYENTVRLSGNGWEAPIGDIADRDDTEIENDDTLVLRFDSWQDVDGKRTAYRNKANGRNDFDAVKEIRIRYEDGEFMTEDGNVLTYSPEKTFYDSMFDGDYPSEEEPDTGIEAAYLEKVGYFNDHFALGMYQVGYCLLYIDDDDIPELYITEMDGDRHYSMLCSYSDGEAYNICEWSEKSDVSPMLGYREKSGEICYIISTTEGSVYKFMNLNGSQFDIKEITYTNGETVYKIDDETISKEEYDSYFDGYVYYTDFDYITDSEELCERLKGVQTE